MIASENIELYHSGISTCSQRVRFVLAEKRIKYADRHVRLDQGEQLASEYLAINPNGLVPALVHNGRTIVDSSVINEYLDEVFPKEPLVPRDPFDRAQMRTWIQYLDEVMTPSIRYPSFQKFFGWKIRSLTNEQRQEFASRLPIRKYFALEIKGVEGFSGETLGAAMERIRSSLLRMEDSLSRTKWLAHDNLTLADIAAMPSIVRLDDLGASDIFMDLPAVVNWYERLQKRPAFNVAYAAGSRLGNNSN